MTTGGGVLREALSTIVRGFLLGVGFSLALLGALYLISRWMDRETEAVRSGSVAARSVALTDLAISGAEEHKHDGATAIIGTVTNSGKSVARGVQVRADLFLHGKFVDQYSTYVSGTIAPGESQHFKISCGCKDSPPAEHDSFKVEVVSDY